MIQRVEFEGGLITLEYNLAPNMVIFSHDFGAAADDHALMSDIAQALPHNFGYVLFNYYDSDETGQNIEIKTFAEQLKRLKTVLDWTRKQNGVEAVHIVGHSLGCIVVARLNPESIGKMILLAPPVSMQDELRNYGENFGAQEKDGIWHFTKKDGVSVNIPDSFFNEMKKIDAEGELQKLSDLREYTLVLPAYDEVMQDADYTDLIVQPTVHATAVDETDHDFQGPGRAQLVKVVCDLLIAPNEPTKNSLR